MAVQTSALNIGSPLAVTATWRSRTLTIILMVAIADHLLGGFEVSRADEKVQCRHAGRLLGLLPLGLCIRSITPCLT